MKAILAIAANELRRVFRDRTALFFSLVVPVMIIVIIGATFGDAGARLDIAVLDRDQSKRSTELVGALDRTGALNVKSYDDIRSLRRDIRTSAVAGGVVVPDGFGADLDGGRMSTVEVVPDPAGSNIAALRTTIDGVIASQGARIAAARFAVEHTGGSYEPSLERAAQIERGLPSIGVETDTLGDTGLSSEGRFSYTAPANLTLFVFVNTVMVGAVLATDRQSGIIRRLLATPNRTRTVLAGIGGAKFAFATVQAALILLIGGLVFGVDWGNPLGAAAVALLWAVVATAVGLLLGSVVSNAEQAQSVAIPVAIGMGMLGGCMWPLEIVPRTMRLIGHVTPQAWAMDAWIELIFRGGGLADVLPQLMVLAGVAAVLGTLAVWRLRLAVTRP